MKKLPYSLVLLTLLVLAGVVPFASRAVYMDEHLFLHIAKNAVEKDWLFPQDTPWTFFGVTRPNLAAQTHPPVGEYCLGLMFELFGGFDEVRFRLLFAVFSVAAVLAFYSLARRFTENPLLVAALFAASPAFFVLSPTLMMDIPMLAFLLAGLALYLDVLEGRSGRLWPASACFVLATGTGYTALVPLGCLFIWAVARGRPRREWAALAAAPGILFLWLMAMKLHFGEVPAVGVVRYFYGRLSTLQNIVPTLSFLGGVSLLPLSILFLVDFPKKRLTASLILPAAIGISFFHSWPSLPHRFWFVLLAASGLAWLAVFAIRSIRRSGLPRHQLDGFLIMWFPATLLFFILAADMITARYILLGLPPLYLITLRRLRLKAGALVFAASLALSFSLAAADYRFVNSYRSWVAATVVPLQEQGFKVWGAAESGLRFYLEKHGAPTLDSKDNRPGGGNLIVGQASFGVSLSEDLKPLLLPIRRQDLNDSFPVRTFNRSAGAGFYDSHFGIVPFTFSRAPLDSLEVLEVSPFVKTLPQVVPADYSSVPLWFPGGVLLKQVQPEMEFRISLPRDIRVEYELEGEASVEISDDCITLRKTHPEPAVWKNFRIVPKGWE